VNEGMPLEPLHVHISKNYHHNATKIWITSTGDLIIDNNNDKIPKKELQKILKIIKSYTNEIATFWKNKYTCNNTRRSKKSNKIFWKKRRINTCIKKFLPPPVKKDFPR